MDKAAEEYLTTYTSERVKDIRNLPSEDQLPLKIQTFLNSLTDLPEHEQIQRVNQFTRDYITYMRGGENDSFIPFQTLVEQPVGDCEDHVQFSAALLAYAGFAPERLMYLNGYVEYPSTEEPEKKGKFEHAILGIHKDNETAYIADMNASDIPILPLNTATISFTSQSPIKENSLINAEMDIYFIFDFTGKIHRAEPADKSRYIQDKNFSDMTVDDLKEILLSPPPDEKPAQPLPSSKFTP